MGFHDRDYYREGSQSPYVTSMVIKLIILNGAVFLAEVLLAGTRDASGQNIVVSLFGAHAETIVHPLYWWQFLTAGFVHDPNGPMHVLFNMLALYCFGIPMEDRYGRREFLRFYLLAVVLGFIFWSASNYWLIAKTGTTLPPCIGASGGVTATLILFCLHNPRATILANLIFPVPAWLFGIVTVASDLYGSANKSALTGGVAYDVHLIGAALAWSYWYFGLNFSRLPGLDELKRAVATPKKWFKPRAPLKVHDPEHYYEDLDAEGDRVLQKLHEQGEKSLTAQERRILEDYSRRTRQKLR